MKPPRLMAAIRGTTPANKLKAKERQSMRGRAGSGCRGSGKQSQEILSIAGFLNPTPLLTEGSCLDFPNTALPRFVGLTPLHTPWVQKEKAGGHYGPLERGAQAHAHKELQTGGNILSSTAPTSLSGPGAPPCPCSHCSLQWLIPSNTQQPRGSRNIRYVAPSAVALFRCLIFIVPQN